MTALEQSLADLEEQAGPRLSFTTAGNTPAALAPLLKHVADGRLVFHAPAGRLHLFPERDAPAASAATAAACGFILRSTRGTDDADGSPRSGAGVLALRGRIRDALDPSRVLAFGERWASGRR